MKATAQISSNNGHTVLPAAVRRFLGIGKGDKVEFESRDNGEVVIRPLPTLEALFGSLHVKGKGKGKVQGKPQADESAQGWNARARRLMRKGMNIDYGDAALIVIAKSTAQQLPILAYDKDFAKVPEITAFSPVDWVQKGRKLLK